MLEATCDIATGDQWSPAHQGSLMLIVHTVDKVDRHIIFVLTKNNYYVTKFSSRSRKNI